METIPMLVHQIEAKLVSLRAVTRNVRDYSNPESQRALLETTLETLKKLLNEF